MPAIGYRLVETDGWRMLPDRLAALGITGPDIGKLQRDGCLAAADRLVTIDQVSEPRPAGAYAGMAKEMVSVCAATLTSCHAGKRMTSGNLVTGGEFSRFRPCTRQDHRDGRLSHEVARDCRLTAVRHDERQPRSGTNDRGEAPAGLQMRANTGRRGPLHATASGKVLLAFANDSTLVDQILKEPLEKLTKTTITDPAKLCQELAEARQLGYATCWQEREVGLCSVGVPLRDYRGTVAGSLTVAGPATRLTNRTLQEHLRPLLASARRIEAHLGASGRGGRAGLRHQK